MLVGFPSSLVEQILRALEEGNFTFYVTGSRYFGIASQNSDYDFFTEDNCTIRPFLENLGFKKMTFCTEAQNYAIALQNNLIVEIWEKHTLHIQLVKNVQHKIRLHEILREFELGKYNKEIRTVLWRFAYHVMPEPEITKDNLGG